MGFWFGLKRLQVLMYGGKTAHAAPAFKVNLPNSPEFPKDPKSMLPFRETMKLKLEYKCPRKRTLGPACHAMSESWALQHPSAARLV